MSFKFRVYLADGEELDDYVAAVPNWQPGDGANGPLRVLCRPCNSSRGARPPTG